MIKAYHNKLSCIISIDFQSTPSSMYSNSPNVTSCNINLQFRGVLHSPYNSTTSQHHTTTSPFNASTSNLNLNTYRFNVNTSTCNASTKNCDAINKIFHANMTQNTPPVLHLKLLPHTIINRIFHLKPYVGQLFSSSSETCKYYYWYASTTEFSVV